MKKYKKVQILLLVILSLSFYGCSSKTVENPTTKVSPNTIVEATRVQVGTFYNGNDGFSLSIPSGNNSTCIWTYDGGSASVPNSITTNANTASEKHAITFPPGTKDLNYNFKVSCVDDFGNQYVGVFPTPNYDNKQNVKNNNETNIDQSRWNW